MDSPNLIKGDKIKWASPTTFRVRDQTLAFGSKYVVDNAISGMIEGED